MLFRSTGLIVGDIANNATVDFANTNPVVYGGAIIGSAGTINQSRGPVRLTRNISAVNVNVQGGFSNALTIATGTSNFISGTLSVGQGLATVGAAGSLIIEPGSVINSFNFMLGQQNTVTGQVAQLGGDVTVSAQFRVGHWPNEVSTYVMGGGSLTMTTLPANNPAGTSTAEQSGGFYIGIDGVGLFTQTGGVVTTHGLVMDNRGSSVLAGFANTYALEGGTLVLGTHGIQSGGASAANQNTAFNVYLGGGTIGSISNWTSPLAMTLTGTNGDVIFNPGSFTNTLNGILSGSGGLIKNGAGTLILGGNNTYFGQTRVNFGTLLYHGTLSASSGTLTVASGATLGGNGTISAPIVMNPGAIMAPGASIGTLTIGSPLALPSSTIMEISKLNGVLSSDILRTTGTLTYGGALTVVVLANAPAFAPGDTFRLFDAPAYAGSFASMNLPALTPGLVWNTTRIAIDGTIRVAFFDITPPMIICPANLTVACSADVPAANFAGGSATDNIDAVPVVTHVGDVSTGVNPRVIIRTYRASDSLGNTNDCAQTITVQDSIAPTITCPADITITANTNTCTAVVALGSPTANDNCTFTVTSNAPAIFPVGTTLVIWTATDSAGNTTTCTQRVKVLDSTLAITASPQDTTNTLGTTATFSVTAAGCPTLTYQWFFLGTNLLADATNATLMLTNIQLSQAGGYSVVVANGGGSVTSAVAVLSLNLPPIAGANGGVAQQGRTATLFVTKFLANDSDPDDDALSVTAVSATSTNGGGVVLSGGEVLYTPLPGFVGNDLFTYTLSDGRGGTATGNVEMYVIDGNVPGANKISMTMLPNGHVLVRFAGVPGRAYEIQRSLNLMSWSRLSTLTAPAHGIIEFEDTTPPMGGAFYRIALP